MVTEEYFAHFRGFEAQATLHSPERMLIDLLQTKLTQNENILPTVNQHIRPALQYHWGVSKVWHAINWQKDTTSIISLAAASIFVDLEKATDIEWQRVVRSYVNEFFAAMAEPRAWKAPLRRIVQWFLPHTSACRDLVRGARVIMHDAVQKRIHEAEAVRETSLPDGSILHRASHIMVNSSEGWSSNIHEHPEVYDGYRFMKWCQTGDKASRLVQSSRGG